MKRKTLNLKWNPDHGAKVCFFEGPPDMLVDVMGFYVQQSPESEPPEPYHPTETLWLVDVWKWGMDALITGLRLYEPVGRTAIIEADGNIGEWRLRLTFDDGRVWAVFRNIQTGDLWEVGIRPDTSITESVSLDVLLEDEPPTDCEEE